MWIICCISHSMMFTIRSDYILNRHFTILLLSKSKFIQIAHFGSICEACSGNFPRPVRFVAVRKLYFVLCTKHTYTHTPDTRHFSYLPNNSCVRVQWAHATNDTCVDCQTTIAIIFCFLPFMLYTRAYTENWRWHSRKRHKFRLTPNVLVCKCSAHFRTYQNSRVATLAE